MGGQGGCERRIQVFVKIQTKNWGVSGGGGSVGGRVGGVRVDVNEELKFLGKFTQKKIRGGFGRGSGGVVGLVGGQGGCERRIEVFVKIQKKNLGGWVLGVGGVGLGGHAGCERRIEVFGKIHTKKTGGGGGREGGQGGCG